MAVDTVVMVDMVVMGYGHYTPIVKKVFVQPRIIKKVVPVYRPVVVKKIIPYKHYGYGGGYGGW